MNAANSSQWLQPAFNDPVLDAQTSFRSALKALASRVCCNP
jgi:alpha-D-ribose 1-methylphosphonate 5-triphosphate synthase subunit PhnH